MNIIKFVYNSAGQLIAVNDTRTGATIAIFRPDGSLHPNYAGFEVPADWVLYRPDLVVEETLEPDWVGLLKGFLSPGNELYESVLSKALSSPLTKHRFDNLQLLLSNPELRNVQGLQFALLQLLQALQSAGNPMEAEEIESWNALMVAHNFPESCRL